MMLRSLDTLTEAILEKGSCCSSSGFPCVGVPLDASASRIRIGMPQVSRGRALKSFRMLLDRRRRLVTHVMIFIV